MMTCPETIQTPGAKLKTYLREHGLTQRELAHQMQRPYQAISEITHNRKRITAQTALQLQKVTRIPAIEWLYLQAEHELCQAMEQTSHENDPSADRQGNSNP